MNQPRPDDHLPLQRSYVEHRIGQLVGIFQIDRTRPTETSEARALPEDGEVVALLAVADGGRLSETAFNVWTVASQMFKEHDCPESQRIDFNLSEFARRLWGTNSRSGSLRRRVVDAVSELIRTRVVVVGVDPYTREPAEGGIWELNLLEAAGARHEMKPIFEAARNGDRTAVAKLASLSWSDAEDKATWSMVLPKWLSDSIRDEQGVILDYDVQRSLRGAAKRIWVQLQSHRSWKTHRLPRPADEAELAELLRALTHDPDRPTVEPADSAASIEVQTLVLRLDSESYEAFGLIHDNRKRSLETACVSILANDLTYLQAEIRPTPRKQRVFDLHLVRAAGELRQERHRDALRERSRKDRSKETRVRNAA